MPSYKPALKPLSRVASVPATPTPSQGSTTNDYSLINIETGNPITGILGHSSFTYTVPAGAYQFPILQVGDNSLTDFTIQILNPATLPNQNGATNALTLNMIFWKNELSNALVSLNNQVYYSVRKNTPVEYIYVNSTFSVSVTLLITYTLKQYSLALEGGIEEGSTSIVGSVNIASFPIVPIVIGQQPTSSPVDVDNGALFAVPITIQNTGSAASAVNTQVLVTLNPSLYSTDEDTYLRNINFQAINGSSQTTLYSWLESGGAQGNPSLIATNNSTVGRYWIVIPVSIPAFSQTVIYMCFYPTNQVKWDGNVTGAAPYLTAGGAYSYGAYDNGANIFNQYTRFGGLISLPAGWSSTGTPTIGFNSIYTQITEGGSGWAGIYRSSTSIDTTQPVVADSLMANYSASTTIFGMGWTDTAVNLSTDAYKSVGSLTSQTASSMFLQGNVNGTTTTSTTNISPWNNLNFPIVWSIIDYSSSSTQFNYYYTGVLNVTTASGNANDFFGVAVSDSNTTLQLYWTRIRIPQSVPSSYNLTVSVGQLQNAASVASGFVPFDVNLTEIAGVPISSNSGLPVIVNNLPLGLQGTTTSVSEVEAQYNSFSIGPLSVGVTATRLSSNQAGGNLILEADIGNTVPVYIGGSSVTTITGFPLVPGSALNMTVSNLNTFYCIAQITGQVLNIFYGVS